MFKGSLVALVTPFKDGAVDDAALEALVEWHIAEGTHGLVPVGTTGESPTLTHAEHERIIEVVVNKAAKPKCTKTRLPSFFAVAAPLRRATRQGRGLNIS